MLRKGFQMFLAVAQEVSEDIDNLEKEDELEEKREKE